MLALHGAVGKRLCLYAFNLCTQSTQVQWWVAEGTNAKAMGMPLTRLTIQPTERMVKMAGADKKNKFLNQRKNIYLKIKMIF